MQLCIKYLWISVNCRRKQQNQCDKMCQVISKIDSRDQAKLAIISSSVEKSMMNRDIPHDVPLNSNILSSIWNMRLQSTYFNHPAKTAMTYAQDFYIQKTNLEIPNFFWDFKIDLTCFVGGH